MLGIKETLIKILTDIKTIKDNLTTLNNKFDSGTWVPHLYDYNTLVRSMPTSRWWRIGKIGLMFILTDNFNYSGITTMMQIRNCPFNTLGGMAYFANLTGGKYGGDITIQASSVGVYFRPNIVSSHFSNNGLNSGRSTIILIGYTENITG